MRSGCTVFHKALAFAQGSDEFRPAHIGCNLAETWRFCRAFETLSRRSRTAFKEIYFREISTLEIRELLKP